MDLNSEVDSLLEKKRFLLSSLNKFLICTICDGYFRFAHTITECGHTFCKICIHDYISKGSNKTRKQCPSCKSELEIHLSKSIRKDPYKQSMVDLLYPHFAKQELTIVKRVKELFPLINMEFLLEEFNYENLPFQNRSKAAPQQSTQINLKLVVETYLKISFEKFLIDIYDDSAFAKMKQLLLESNPEFYEKETPTKSTSEAPNSTEATSLDKKTQQSEDPALLGKRSSSKYAASEYEPEPIKKQQSNNNNNSAIANEEKGIATDSNIGSTTNVGIEFESNEMNDRSEDDPEINSKTKITDKIPQRCIAKMLKPDENLYLFFVRPRTQPDFDLFQLFNLLYLQKSKKTNGWNVLTIKKTIIDPPPFQKKLERNQAACSLISPKDLNIYFDGKLLTDDYLPLDDIYAQCKTGAEFIFEYEAKKPNPTSG